MTDTSSFEQQPNMPAMFTEADTAAYTANTAQLQQEAAAATRLYGQIEAQRGRVEIAEHNADFYESLGQIAMGVIEDDYEGKSIFSHPDGKYWTVDDERGPGSDYRGAIGDAPEAVDKTPTSLSRTVDPRIVPGRRMSPHIRDESRVVNDSLAIRDMRKTQERNAAIFGHSGHVDGRANRKAQISEQKQIKRDLKRGLIDSAEAARRTRLLKAGIKEVVDGDGRVRTESTIVMQAPHDVHKLEKKIDRKVSRTGQFAGRRVDRAIDEETLAIARLEQKEQELAAREQSIRQIQNSRQIYSGARRAAEINEELSRSAEGRNILGQQYGFKSDEDSEDI